MHYAFPSAITLPIAAVYMTYFYSVGIQEDAINAADDNSQDLRLNISATGQYIASKLTEINIPEENQLKIINMLDTLDWVKVNNTCTRWYTKLVQKICADFINDKSGHFFFLLTHVCYLLAFHMIIEHSILGIFMKIIINHLKLLLLYPFKYFAFTKKYFTIKDNDVSEEGCAEEDVLAELREIDSEEVLAKENQAEEKRVHGGTSCDADNGYESFIQPLHSSQGGTARKSTPRDDNVAAPDTMSEKFKQFLHQRNENVERIEVSFSEDGYLSEDSGDESLCHGVY